MKPLRLLPLLLLPAIAASGQTNLPDAATVIEVMRRANDYWIANNSVGNAGWANSAYYTGNQRAARFLNDTNYLNRSLNWAAANNWRIGPEAGANNDADSQCSGQTYIDLYRMDPQPNRIASIRQKMDSIVATNRVDQWWWIDAFYMAGPAFARLGNLFGDTNYFHKAGLMYEDMKVRRALFDPASGLWFRDSKYLYPTATTINGQKIFWSRGNGWVIAGLARTLEQMPADASERAEFVSMFQTMAAALKPLQGADGMWRSSLHDAAEFPNPETSGTAFFLYSMAWGVRNGFLNAADYTNTLALGWHGLTNIALLPSGRVVYVQAVGQKPAAAGTNETATYGVGAFLLACSEICLLAPDSPTVSPCAGGDEAVNDADRNGWETVTLDGAATELYKGTADFSWWTNGVLAATGMVAQISLPLGTNIVTLNVLGSDGANYTDDVVKTIFHLPPILPNAGADELVYDADRNGEESVSLDGSATVILSGAALSYDWWLGDIWLGSGANAQAILPHGRHVITLRVLGGDGSVFTDDVIKHVAPFPFVSASGFQVPNYPTNTIDGQLATRWSSDGVGQRISFDLGQKERVSGVQISIYNGDARRAYFTVHLSVDGSFWLMHSTNTSSGTTTDLERFVFSPVNARHLRITSYGNSQNTWASFQEIAIESQLLQTDSEPDNLPDAWEMARAGGTTKDSENDDDGDGRSLWQEYVSGTNPAMPDTAAPLTVRGLENGEVELSVQTRAAFGPGYTGLQRCYRLEATEDLKDMPWTSVSGSEEIVGNNLSATWTLPTTNQSRLFRVRTWLQPIP